MLIPFYDPLEIFKYAIENNNSYKKIVGDEKIKYDFKFASDSIAVKHIFITENNKNNSFVIEFIYQSLQDEIKEIISYKILPDSSNKETKNIMEYIQEKNGKFILRSEFKNYAFFNNTSLESILRGHQ